MVFGGSGLGFVRLCCISDSLESFDGILYQRVEDVASEISGPQLSTVAR